MSGNLFARLRKKPKHVRNNIAFGAASGFTALVLVGWLMTTPASLFKDKAVASEEPKIFKTFFDQLGQQFASVKNALPNATTTSIQEAVQGSEAAFGSSTSTSRKEVFIIPVKASSTATSSATTTRW